jgi:hypothetical protein
MAKSRLPIDKEIEPFVFDFEFEQNEEVPFFYFQCGDDDLVTNK